MMCLLPVSTEDGWWRVIKRMPLLSVTRKKCNREGCCRKSFCSKNTWSFFSESCKAWRKYLNTNTLCEWRHRWSSQIWSDLCYFISVKLQFTVQNLQKTANHPCHIMGKKQKEILALDSLVPVGSNARRETYMFFFFLEMTGKVNFCIILS